MASSIPCRKSRFAGRFASCHKHTNPSLLSISKICLDVPWQFPASLKLHPPPSLTPMLMFANKLIHPFCHIPLPALLRPQLYSMKFSRLWLFLFDFFVIHQATMVLFSPIIPDRTWKAKTFHVKICPWKVSPQTSLFTHWGLPETVCPPSKPPSSLLYAS